MEEVKRILVAEDDDSIARLIEFKLVKEGYVVTRVADGDAALRLCGEGGWDAAILDVMMPGRSGWEVLESLRSGGSLLPVLILTAQGGRDIQERAAHFPATAVLRKPMSPRELLASVRGLTGARSEDTAASTGEVRELRRDFVETLPDRVASLRNALGREATDRETVRSEIHILAHNLSGSASTFGFPFLGRLASAVEVRTGEPGMIEDARFLLEVLDRAVATGSDPADLDSDPRAKALISAAESRS